jgi:spermidine synthase
MFKTFSKTDLQQKTLLFVFFLSGFSALIYQVVWQRWLVFFTGISTVNISLIISAFLTGIGIGYLVGGIIADKTKKEKNL